MVPTASPDRVSTLRPIRSASRNSSSSAGGGILSRGTIQPDLVQSLGGFPGRDAVRDRHEEVGSAARRRSHGPQRIGASVGARERCVVRDGPRIIRVGFQPDFAPQTVGSAEFSKENQVDISILPLFGRVSRSAAAAAPLEAGLPALLPLPVEGRGDVERRPARAPLPHDGYAASPAASPAAAAFAAARSCAFLPGCAFCGLLRWSRFSKPAASRKRRTRSVG